MKNVLVLSGFGINCEKETDYAFKAVGANSKIIHVNEIIKNPTILDDCDILVFPGGFSFGDHLGAGFALASLIRVTIFSKIEEMIRSNKIILGICNGCQILVKLGLFNDQEKKISITNNDNNIGYRCLWRECESTGTWHFNNITEINLPVAHGEGRFIDLDPGKNSEEKKIMLEGNLINDNCKIILKYAANQNHNGSDYDVAGISNGVGNVIALMPHPERAIVFDQTSKERNIKHNNPLNTPQDVIESRDSSTYLKFFHNLVSCEASC
jgi:phosphoribosylformylglycinamidine (FGAM) synthase-like amidotransferase family enzyme